MEHIGIDLHKNQSQVCILTEAGELVHLSVRTERERFAAVLGGRAPARILLEASTESEWVARCLEELGQEVIVADPNYAPMYAQRTRRVKTNRRDAEALAMACRLGAYRPVHRCSDEQRSVRMRLAVREALVRTRGRYLSLIRARLRQQGWRVRSGSARAFFSRLQELSLPAALSAEIAPLLVVMAEVNQQIQATTREISQRAEQEETLQRFCTVPAIGSLTATAFQATVDRVERFASAHQLEAYLGLVPREHSSAEKQQRGPITKAGDPRTRSLLVEAAWNILRYQRPETTQLRLWALRLAARRGKRIAAVALARRLAGILYALWRDGTPYQPERVGSRQRRCLVAA